VDLLTKLSAKNSINLSNGNNDFNELKITLADDVFVTDKNRLVLSGINASGDVDLSAVSGMDINASCSDGCVDAYGIKAANIHLSSLDGSLVIGKNILSDGLVELSAKGIVVNDKVVANAVDLNTVGGDLTINQGADVTAGAGSIGMTAINMDQRANLVAEGSVDISLSANGLMSSTSVIKSNSGNISYKANNLALGLLDAKNGGVTIESSGAISDVNEAETNILANSLALFSESGVGNSTDAIETSVQQLSVSNNVNDVNISNKGALTINRLQNNGNISLHNDVDIVLDNQNLPSYHEDVLDARLQGGTANANYVLGTLTIAIDDGDLSATGSADKQNPDIVADQLFLKLNRTKGASIGQRSRPLILHVRSYYEATAAFGSTRWHSIRPAATSNDNPNDFGLLESLISGDQLIQVEALNDVDPAIFTGVRNYVYDDVAILMPADQRYEEDEEDE